ncbi:MAG: hypothetical protein ACLUI3_07415 [Christensenellales bacterium]
MKYAFERGTTLAPARPDGVSGGQARAKGTLRYASFGLSAKHEEHVYLYAADGRTSDEIELPALGTDGAYRRVDGSGGGCARCAGASGGRNLSLYNGEARAIMQKRTQKLEEFP